MKIKTIEKLLSIDRRIIFLLVAAVILIPIIKPLNLPVQVTPEVLGVYDAIDKLPEGSKILIAFDYEPASTPEMDPMAKALLRHCFKKKLRVVGISWLEQGRGNADNVLSFITNERAEKG
ncbi:MAG TPA: hypothetical protein P5557_13965, partial [Candidatus Sumerlaeia bacterium]|nr:hypothetical protein [Candidatus Sumerlaeia bacterium]